MDDNFSMSFINDNYLNLKREGVLEIRIKDAYLHAENFIGISFEDLKKIFDACDRQKLRDLYPLPELLHNHKNPISLFRGCVGSSFREGMSWTTCLRQAIRYPARAKLFNHYGGATEAPCSVYAALVELSDVYCFFDHYEPEFIACPQEYWQIDIPQDMFVLKAA